MVSKFSIIIITLCNICEILFTEKITSRNQIRSLYFTYFYIFLHVQCAHFTIHKQIKIRSLIIVKILFHNTNEISYNIRTDVACKIHQTSKFRVSIKESYVKNKRPSFT